MAPKGEELVWVENCSCTEDASPYILDVITVRRQVSHRGSVERSYVVSEAPEELATCSHGVFKALDELIHASAAKYLGGDANAVYARVLRPDMNVNRPVDLTHAFSAAIASSRRTSHGSSTLSRSKADPKLEKEAQNFLSTAPQINTVPAISNRMYLPKSKITGISSRIAGRRYNNRRRASPRATGVPYSPSSTPSRRDVPYCKPDTLLTHDVSPYTGATQLNDTASRVTPAQQSFNTSGPVDFTETYELEHTEERTEERLVKAPPKKHVDRIQSTFSPPTIPSQTASRVVVSPTQTPTIFTNPPTRSAPHSVPLRANVNSDSTQYWKTQEPPPPAPRRWYDTTLRPCDYVTVQPTTTYSFLPPSRTSQIISRTVLRPEVPPKWAYPPSAWVPPRSWFPPPRTWTPPPNVWVPPPKVWVSPPPEQHAPHVPSNQQTTPPNIWVAPPPAPVPPSNDQQQQQQQDSLIQKYTVKIKSCRSVKFNDDKAKNEKAKPLISTFNL